MRLEQDTTNTGVGCSGCPPQPTTQHHAMARHTGIRVYGTALASVETLQLNEGDNVAMVTQKSQQRSTNSVICTRPWPFDSVLDNQDIQQSAKVCVPVCARPWPLDYVLDNQDI